MTKKAVVLLSGGLDSAVTLAFAKRAGFECYALSFRYGQRHELEIDSAGRVATALGAKDWETCFAALKGSALTWDGEVPKGGVKSGIPVTYVPARNTVFLAHALSYAETHGIRDIFIGVNAVDYSGYPDCRPEFVQTFEHLANLATKSGVEGDKFTVHSPLISKSKADIVRLGLELGVDFSLTSSCYDPAYRGACGECDSCRIRLRAFEEVGIKDPIRYRNQKTLYLAGPINNCTDAECKDWREEAKRVFSGFRFKDPMVRDYRGREDEAFAEIVEFDKQDIDESDALLVNYDKPSVGTSMEILYAWESGCRVVVVAKPGTRISPWLRYHSTAIVGSLEEAKQHVL